MRFLVVLLLAGCSHAAIDARSNTSTGAAVPSAGTTVTSGSAGLHVESRSLASLILAGMFVAAAIDYSREPRPFPSFSETFGDWLRGTPAPQMAHNRNVVEQDCTKPLPEDLAGNLKCR
jgi:hypothetical protein